MPCFCFKPLPRIAFKTLHLVFNCSFYFFQFLLTHHYFVSSYCQFLFDDRTVFLLFIGMVSSSVDVMLAIANMLKNTVFLFLLLLEWDYRLL